MAALPVVLDAAYGVVLADQLRETELAILLGPWRDIAGDPFEPGSPHAAFDAGDPDDRAAAEAGWSGDTGSADDEAWAADLFRARDPDGDPDDRAEGRPDAGAETDPG